MQSRGDWSVALLRTTHLTVRMHALLLLFGVLVLYAGSQAEAFWHAWLLLFSLAVALVVHEAGHLYFAWQFHVRGPFDIVLGPLGGMKPLGRLRDPARDALVAVAGPASNLLLALFLSVPLLAFGQLPAGLLTAPLNPNGVLAAWDIWTVLRTLFWVNVLMSLVNLLPVVPLDGGRLVFDYLATHVPPQAALLRLGALGMVTGCFLCALAALVGYFSPPSPSQVPPWLPLVLLGLLVFFRGQELVHGGDLAEGPARIEEPHEANELDADAEVPDLELVMEAEEDDAETSSSPGLIQWLKSRNESTERGDLSVATEQDEDRRVDEILSRVTVVGISGLTPEERQILDKVSERLRAKKRKN